MSMIFEDLEAWRDARIVVRNVYSLCEEKRLDRDFGLKDQIQRASVSVMTTLAEGFERTGTKEKLQFYNFAKASNGEVRSLLYVIEDNYPELAEQALSIRTMNIGCGKKIMGLMRSFRHRMACVSIGLLLSILLGFITLSSLL